MSPSAQMYLIIHDVSVVDVPSMKEVARIPVGFVPKRNATGMLP